MDKKDKVRICVDELGVVPDPGNKEPIRALSLNRLNISEREVEPLYKCPSFPRLTQCRQRHHRNNAGPELYLSPSLQHADSVSVQPSLDNISPGGDGDELGVLPRCSSARAVGERETNGRLPPLDYHPTTSSNLLSPAPTDAANLVARSTSCPAIHPQSPHPLRSGRGTGSPHHGSSRHDSPQLQMEPADDVDLQGEVITDLPIEATQTFPDFFPVAVTSSESQFEEHPMHTRRIRERTAQYSNRRQGKSGTTVHRDGFLNIGDIPSAIAQKVILEQDTPFMPEQRDKVQVKCMKWLNTLNNNN